MSHKGLAVVMQDLQQSPRSISSHGFDPREIVNQDFDAGKRAYNLAAAPEQNYNSLSSGGHGASQFRGGKKEGSNRNHFYSSAQVAPMSTRLGGSSQTSPYMAATLQPMPLHPQSYIQQFVPLQHDLH